MNERLVSGAWGGAPEPVEALAGWFSAPPPPEESALLELEKESQYGAWLLAFGRKVNHFTGSVDDVEVWQRRMREAGVPMKADIEGAPGTALRQTARAWLRWLPRPAGPRPLRHDEARHVLSGCVKIR